MSRNQETPMTVFRYLYWRQRSVRKTSRTERMERELKCSPLLILCAGAFVLGGWRSEKILETLKSKEEDSSVFINALQAQFISCSY